MRFMWKREKYIMHKEWRKKGLAKIWVNVDSLLLSIQCFAIIFVPGVW